MSKREKIKHTIKSKDGKILIENFLSLSFLNVVGYIFPLITLPYLSRVIGIAGFGEIAFAASIIVYFETITSFGFNYIAVREISRNKENPDKISEIFSTTMVAKIFLMLLSMIILTTVTFAIPSLREKSSILLYTFLIVPANIMFPDWFFQGMEKMKYITVLNVISRTIFTLLIFVIITQESDYIYQPILNAFGVFFSGLISLYYIKRNFNVKFILPSCSDVFNAIRGNSNMFLYLFLPNMYTNFSVTFLGMTHGIGSVGIFSSGKKFIDLSDQVFSVISRTFFPFLARRGDKHTLYSQFTFVISVVISIVLFLSADLLIKIFYTPEFAVSADIIRIMSISPIFFNLMSTYGTNYLVLHNKENILRNIVIFCSIGGFCLTLLLTDKYGSIGVAITITLVWGIRGVLTLLYALKFKRKKISL